MMGLLDAWLASGDYGFSVGLGGSLVLLVCGGVSSVGILVLRLIVSSSV